MASRLLVLCSVLTVSACNSVFYQGDHHDYYSPKNFGLRWQDLRIGPVGEEINLWAIDSKLTPARATVVHFHGNAQNMAAHLSFTYWLPDYGYNLICFDYRGYGRSGGAATRANSIEDAERVLAWVQSQQRYQSLPLFILGQSLGGSIAVTVLGRQQTALPNLVGLVVDSSFASYRSIARRKLASWWLTWPLQVPLSWLISDELSPREVGQQVEVPALFFHSRIDPAVPYEEGQALFRSLGSRHKEFVTLEQAGHTVALRDQKSRWAHQLLEFLKITHSCVKGSW